VVTMREALGWSALWISIGVSFSAFVYFGYERHWLGLGMTVDTMSTPVLTAEGLTAYNDGGSAVVKYLTGFLVEKSLAVDNIFVIAMIFGFFAVPPIYQHRVLFWGIVGALIMRGAMIALGAALITKFSWIIYVFGAFLILTGVKMLVLNGGESDLNQNVAVKLVRRFMSVTERYHGERFFVRAGTEASHAPAFAPSTRFQPSSPSRRTRSSCSRATSSPSWACAACTSPSPG
jgi:tellurite resistance protein TerC